jgi:hypothetical protein
LVSASRLDTKWGVRRLTLLLAVLALLGALGGAASAQASPWTLTTLNLGDGETIFGMHCEPSGFCVGVGQEGVVVQSTAPTAGPSAWTIGHVAVGSEGLAANLRGISCPSATLCVAIDFSGGVWTTTDPGAGAASWTPTKIPKAKALFGIDCQTTTQCVVVGSGGLVLTSSNPTGGPTAWTRYALPNGPPLRAVTCTGLLCVASASNGEIWTTRSPAGGAAGGAAAWVSAGQPAGEGSLLGVSCLSESLCTVGGEGKVLVSTAPTAGFYAWPTTPLPNRFQIVGTDCPQANLCILSSNNGEVTAAGNPIGGPQAWLTEHLIKGVTNALFGLSCPTEALCVAAGKFGQILTTTQPNATGQPLPPPPPPPPTTVFRHTPPPLIRLGVHGAAPTVAFNFGAEGTGPFWFRCKLDSNPNGVCTAPFKKRVGVGNHAFRVRAFGPGGGATQLVYKFKVERAKPKPKPKPKKHPGAGGK